MILHPEPALFQTFDRSPSSSPTQHHAIISVPSSSCIFPNMLKYNKGNFPPIYFLSMSTMRHGRGINSPYPLAFYILPFILSEWMYLFFTVLRIFLPPGFPVEGSKSLKLMGCPWVIRTEYILTKR